VTASTVLAAGAALSYLDARFHLLNDYFLIYPVAAATATMYLRQRRGILNQFYRLEERALTASPEVSNKDFLVYQGQTWSYKAAYEMVLKYATWLKERHGVKRRELVAMDFTNKPEFLWIWFGLWALGAVPAFINYNLEGERLVHCVNASTATLVLVDEEVKKVLEDPETLTKLEDGGKRRVVVFDAHLAAGVATWNAVRPPDEERKGVMLPDPAMLIYTSGTTGMPKAAVVSWHKLNYGGGFSMRWLGLRKSDRFYTSMPLYHSSAAILGVNTVLNAGATLVLGHKFSIRRTLPELRESRATIFQYVGETCRYLLTAPPSPDDKNHNVRIAFGNGLRPDVWKEFKVRFGIPAIAEFYASTEGMSGSWHLQTGEFGIGAIGKNGLITNLLLGRGTKIVKLDYDTELPYRDPKTGFMVQCAPGEPGELIWRLPADDVKARFQGYFGDDAASNDKVMRDCFVKGDAWFRTGDLQRRDPDGLWYFMDRIGDTFRWKSENVSTAEVAGVLGSHPGIKECTVYGVALPKHEGKAGCAAIVLREGWDAERVLAGTEEIVKALPKYARPVFVRVVKELEKTGNNKIVKRALQEEGVKDGAVEDVWWCPQVGAGYVGFGKEDWHSLGRGGVKL
jgi:acyl-CoA synthetase (AMP-forming)/AMP-acid ligase II